MSKDDMKMRMDNVCAVCCKPLKKGDKFYSMYCSGGKEIFTCSRKCNKEFDTLNDIVFDILNKGISFTNEYVKDGYTYLIDEEFCEYVYKLARKDLSIAEITTKMFDYLEGIEDIEE